MRYAELIRTKSHHYTESLVEDSLTDEVYILKDDLDRNFRKKDIFASTLSKKTVDLLLKHEVVGKEDILYSPNLMDFMGKLYGHWGIETTLPANSLYKDNPSRLILDDFKYLVYTDASRVDTYAILDPTISKARSNPLVSVGYSLYNGQTLELIDIKTRISRFREISKGEQDAIYFSYIDLASKGHSTNTDVLFCVEETPREPETVRSLSINRVYVTSHTNYPGNKLVDDAVRIQRCMSVNYLKCKRFLGEL